MRILRGFALAALSLLVANAAYGQATRIANARLRSEAASGGLGATINRLLRASPARVWAAWDVPMIGRRHVCCFGTTDAAEKSPCGGRCYLESENRNSGFFDSDSGDCIDHDTGDRLLLFARLEGSRLTRLRTFSQDCALEAEGATVIWLTGVSAAESVAFLEPLVHESDLGRKPGKHSGEPALSAIAMHEDAAADAALQRFVAPGQPDRVRQQAAFWLGNARGRAGYLILKGLAQKDSSDDLRRHVTFALSQSSEGEAVDTLIGMARNDSSSRVRSQALFWLAQKAGHKAVGAIRDAIAEDPETEVKRKAVFALSQLPKDEGIPQLIQVARTNRNPEVRKQAIFWLGQSNDPRALSFIEEIVLK